MEQDDEEREIRTQLLGKISKNEEIPFNNEIEKTDAKQEAFDKSCFLCHKKGHVANSCPEKPQVLLLI